MVPLNVALLGWVASPLLLSHGRYASTQVVAHGRCAATHHTWLRTVMKATPDETPEIRPEISINKMAVVEFHDDSKKGTPILGLVQGAEYKAKGGARIMITDASGGTHTVKESAIHINLGVYKGKLVEPSDILEEYSAVMTKEPTALGVDVDDLELAWELCAEADKPNFSAKNILSLVDDGFFKSKLDAYRAFRLLTSDLGKVFFKTVSGDAFKPKNPKSVQASKDQWCREQTELDWCFV
jgi:hypothetical protein